MEEEKMLIVRSDLDLVRRAQSGDTEAFAELYRENAGHIYATCLRMLANKVRAQEMAQDAIVKGWQMLATFRNDCPFSAWLHRIAVNAVLDHLRGERRLRSRIEFSDDIRETDPAGGSTSPEEMLDLETGIASLPVQARLVLILHDIEGYRHEEIAELMGIATGTSKAQLHRARTLLKERLEP